MITTRFNKTINTISDALEYLDARSKQLLRFGVKIKSHKIYEWGIIAYKTYQDKTYHYIYDFGYEYPEESARFIFFDGNYSCDCNLSSFIQEQDENFPFLKCGDEIKIENFVVRYEV